MKELPQTRPNSAAEPPEEEFLPEEPSDGGDPEDSDSQDVITRDPAGNPGEPSHAKLIIHKKLPGRRLDKYLHHRFRKVSRTTIQRLIKTGDILVNGRPTKASYEMEVGDVVNLTFPPPEPYEVVPENIPLDILYEDDYVLAINKPIGMIAHPASRSQTGTVANALSYYSSKLAKTDDPFRPGIVHRLDKNTTGIMIVAKTDEAHWRLALQFEERKTEKVYLAVVHGVLDFDEDVIDVPIGKHPIVHDRYVATGFAERLGGKFEKRLSKSAITRYKMLERFNGYSLVELYPKTGRTHQLRIHMSHIKHPIVGDPFYGGRNISAREISGRIEDSPEPCFARQMLHAARLTVMHPILETPLTIEAPPPGDMMELIEMLRMYRASAEAKGAKKHRK